LRILWGGLEAHFETETRAVQGVPGLTERLARGQHLALRDLEEAQMGVEAEVAATVVEDDHGTVALVEVGEHHPALSHSGHGGSRAGGDEEPRIDRSGAELGVEALAESLGQGALHGPGQQAPQG